MIKNIVTLNFFQGKKTYIISALLIAYAVGGYFTGHMTLDQFVQILGIGGVGSTLRKAM